MSDARAPSVHVLASNLSTVFANTMFYFLARLPFIFFKCFLAKHVHQLAGTVLDGHKRKCSGLVPVFLASKHSKGSGTPVEIIVSAPGLYYK